MNEDIKIFLICGKARTGKNTVGSILKEKIELSGNKVCEIQIISEDSQCFRHWESFS